MLDQHSNPEKLSPLGGEFITRSSLNLPSGFKVEGVGEHRRGLVEAARMSYVSLLHPTEVTQIHGSLWGWIVKQNPLWQMLLR